MSPVLPVAALAYSEGGLSRKALRMIPKCPRAVAVAALALCACLGASSAQAASRATMTMNPELLVALSSNSVSISAVSPAAAEGAVLSMPVKTKGATAILKGGLELSTSMGAVSLERIKVDTRSGRASALVGSASTSDSAEARGILSFRGGKNTFSSNGKWKNAKVYIAKSAVINGQVTDPARLICSTLQVPIGTVAQGQRLGKVTIVAQR